MVLLILIFFIKTCLSCLKNIKKYIFLLVLLHACPTMARIFHLVVLLIACSLFGAVSATLIDAEADFMLQQHNDARAAAGVPPLFWDEKLAQAASDWASGCPINPLRHSSIVSHLPLSIYGPNLFIYFVAFEWRAARYRQLGGDSSAGVGENLFGMNLAQL